MIKQIISSLNDFISPKKEQALPTYEEIQEKIIITARQYVGVREIGGNNKGPMVELFQKAVDGRAQGEPWCLSYVFYVAQEVCESYQIDNPLFKSEHCQTMYDYTPDRFKRKPTSPIIPGSIFIKKSFEKMSGHAGFNTVGGTIEGNTNDGTSRDGNGVYEKFTPIADDRSKFVRGHIDLPQMIFDQIMKTKNNIGRLP